MPSTGGSHTAFDSAAFTVGALSGATTMAAALGAGIRNYTARRALAVAEWTIENWRQALALSELLRRRDHQRFAAEKAAFRKVIQDQRTEILGLRASLAVTQAHAHRPS
jgi:hypothetical protein